MAKNRPVFTCTSCGAEYSRWSGRCTSCGEWNTIEESSPVHKNSVQTKTPSVCLLSEISEGETKRLITGIKEFNLVCGGGIVPGSVILMGGEPGIGKSTMALQCADYFETLYISGEETPAQIKTRAARLGINMSRIRISTDRSVQAVNALAVREKPELLIVDSIQTVYSEDLPGTAGSVNQIRACASALADTARNLNLPVIIIGHITKDGNIAGPKILEHLVDTVLYFEGDFTRDLRILRSFKNRYGSVNEAGLFRMTRSGLEEVRDKNTLFLHSSSKPSSGSAVSAAIEGSRTILFEVQSLVSFTTYPNPRRMADGFDMNRLIILAAVLEKHAGLKLSSFDIFINLSSGFRITEPAADLAVAAAIASSLKDSPLPLGLGLMGEISLSGDLRPVPQCGRRAAEFRSSGFTKILCCEQDAEDIRAAGFTGEILAATTVSGALKILADI